LKIERKAKPKPKKPNPIYADEIKIMPSQQTVNNRIQLLKSGFKKYASIRKLPIDAETKWSLEVVSIDSSYPIPPNFLNDPNIDIDTKGKLYSIQSIIKFTNTINQNKLDWIRVMKS
jgi:hypothetical protein